MKFQILTCMIVFLGLQRLEAGGLPAMKDRERHRFAQLYLSLEIERGMQFGKKAIHAGSIPLVRIGGMHFWGRACFSIAFPVMKTSSNYRRGVETAARFYWWSVYKRRFTPYTGLAWQSRKYAERGAGAVRFYRYPLSVGCVWQIGSVQLTAGAARIRKNSLIYYRTNEAKHEVTLNAWYLHAGIRILLETTLSAEKNWKNGLTARATDSLAGLRRLNGMNFTSGLSSGIRLKQSDFIINGKNQLGNQRSYNLFPEFGIGYYFHRPDVQMNASWRSMKAKSTAGEESFETGRKSLALEGYKFISDYHGFAFFAGPTIGLESLSAKYSKNKVQMLSGSRKMIRPGLTIGWDIRPDRLQAFYIRTTLRWFPGLLLHDNGYRESLDTLEINFFQIVIFPDRMF